MKVALYLRRSTNERLQADSLRTQLSILRDYAETHGMTTVAIFRDSASGTTTRHRKAFLRMVETIRNGAPFSVVLVRDVTRFGRFYDIDEGAFYEFLFLSHGVQTIYCEETFANDPSPMASLLKGVKRVMAAEYSRDKARLVRCGQMRAVRQGFHPGGQPGYGLRRVMVTMEGKVVSDLARGEWKALLNHRIKLLAGAPEEVAIVQRIFHSFAEEGSSVVTIVRQLNREQVPGPRGGLWNAPSVAAVLENPRYIGVVRYRPSPAPPASFEGARDDYPAVEAAGAIEPIIGADLWHRTQERLSRAVRRRPSDSLAKDLKEAYARHGSIEERMLARLSRPFCWTTVRNRFPGGIDEALRLAFASQISAARSEIEALLRESFELADHPDGWTIDATLRVAFLSAFRHRARWGINWLIPASPSACDLVLAVGIRPDGSRTKELFLARRTQVETRAFGLRAVARYALSPEELPERITKLKRAHLPGPDAAFLSAARAMPAVNFRRLERELGWPAHVIRRTYWRLIDKGEWLPPLKKSAGRWIELTCSSCGMVRRQNVIRALRHKRDLCHVCAAHRPICKISCRCPRCGRVALRWPSQVRALSRGNETPCRPCARGLRRGQTSAITKRSA